MGIVLILKLVTSIAIVFSVAYFNWWLNSVYPSIRHSDESDPMGPFLWDFKMNVTNVTILTNSTFQPSAYEEQLFGNASSRQVTLVTFAHPTEFTYAKYCTLHARL